MCYKLMYIYGVYYVEKNTINYATFVFARLR